MYKKNQQQHAKFFSTFAQKYEKPRHNRDFSSLPYKVSDNFILSSLRPVCS